MAISSKKALEAAKVIVDFCNEQEGCQNCWYGKDMVLTEEQEKQLADFVSDNLPYHWVAINNLIASAILHGSKVVINADW